jgi:rhodanese-related sulfurtransferase
MSNKIIHTRKSYLALAGIFVLLALVLLFLPEKDNTKKLQPEKLLISLNDNSRIINTDQVADRLINSDPSILLIDVRSAEEFNKGSLPGAINIPLSEILEAQSLELFERKAYDKVLFSNGDVLADQAWVLLSGKLMDRIFIMDGGLNYWIKTIVNPQKPGDESPVEDFELYNTRVAASRYFAGMNTAFEYVDVAGATKPVVRSAAKTKTAAPVLPPPPAQEEEEEEGC